MNLTVQQQHDLFVRDRHGQASADITRHLFTQP